MIFNGMLKGIALYPRPRVLLFYYYSNIVINSNMSNVLENFVSINLVV